MIAVRGMGQTGIFSNYPLTGADFLCAIPGAGFTQYCKDLAAKEVYGEIPVPSGPIVTAPPVPNVSMTQAPSSAQAAQQAAQDVSNAQVQSTQASMQSFVDTSFPDTSTSLFDNPTIMWVLFGGIALVGFTMLKRGR